jgi:hypothetical protein
MPLTPLTAGYNVIITQKTASGNKPIYPFTRSENVKDALGNTVASQIKALQALNHVPDYSSETANSLRFLRNDNTWQTIQSASTSQAGVVQLDSSLTSSSETTAATSKAVKDIKDDLDALDTSLATTFVKLSQLGVASVQDGDTGVATLGTDGKVPAAQLPSFVDDVIEGYYNATDGKFYEEDTFTTEITGEGNKIYVDLASNKTYRYSGSTFVVISETLALGETESTAYRGDRGKIAYDHSQDTHARTDATKVEASDTPGDGTIKVYGRTDETATVVTVYTHPIASGFDATNPHGITKSTIGLDNVENKSSETIRGELTSSNVTTALGYTPLNAATFATSSVDGVMSKEYAAKLDNAKEIIISSNEPTFASGEGIWLQVVSEDPTT